jgi:hypothetical protein
MTHEIEADRAGSEARWSDERMQRVAWASALLMTGTLWLTPASWAPEGSWLAGLGLILLGLNAARYLRGLRTDGLGAVAGGAALVAGLGRMLGGQLPFVPLLLVVLGAAMLVAAVAETRKRDAVWR